MGNDAEPSQAVIRDAASRFRQAFDEQHGQLLCPTFREFPKGSCGDASELLGQYLQDSGLGEWQYVSGALSGEERFQSHAWIERDGLIVDITADQFPDIDEPVLITDDRTWHEQFGPAGRQVASLSHYLHDDKKLSVNADYQVLKRRADEIRAEIRSDESS